MAKKHNRPCLHIDLNKSDLFQASQLLMEWTDEYKIKTLNVAGPWTCNDPKGYKEVKEVLEILLMLESRRDRIFESLQPNKLSTNKNIRRPTTVD